MSAIYVVRLAFALAGAVAAIKVGLGYIHLCHAGSRAVECSAAFVVPALCIILILAIRRLWLGIGLAVLVIVISQLLCQPYLDLVHGPSSPWPALM